MTARLATDDPVLRSFADDVGSEGPVTDISVFDVVASGVSYLDNQVPVVAKLRARGAG